MIILPPQKKKKILPGITTKILIESLSASFYVKKKFLKALLVK